MYLCRMKHDIVRSILGHLQISLFVAYITCIICFTHADIVDGVLVIHSHPTMMGANASSSSHTNEELLLLDNIFHLTVFSSITEELYLTPSYVITNVLLGERLAHFKPNSQLDTSHIRGSPRVA